MVFSSYYPGTTEILGVALDGSGDIYLTGTAQFPTFPLAHSPGEIPDHPFAGAFAAKVSKDGNAIDYSVLLDGNDSDRGWNVDVTPNGEAAITVWTDSSDYPLVNQFRGYPDPPLEGNDVAVTKLGADGTILFSTYVGGSSSDQPGGVTVSASGDVYYGVITSSPDIGATHDAYETTIPSTTSAFVAKIAANGKKRKHHDR